MNRALPALVAELVSAQSLADRIAAVRDGVVHMSFASRPDVCSDATGSIWTTRGSYIGDGNRVCVHGPVHVILGRADNQTVSVRARIADRWRFILRDRSGRRLIEGSGALSHDPRA